ncbi:Ig-like domain-containing protein [Pseudomonas stutzeri]|nr:Ig-like domain-containing protein [Stutzerimonas stutzeri]
MGYTVTDGSLTDTATLTLTVTPVNDAPLANDDSLADDSLAATEDTPVTFSAADLLGNDSDVDGDSLSIASVTSGTGGSAVLARLCRWWRGPSSPPRAAAS